MNGNLQRLPTVFKPKKKPLPEPSEEPDDLEGKVAKTEATLPANNTYSGVNMRGYINETIKYIKALEKLRKQKYNGKEFAQRAREIKRLSERVQSNIEDIVSQVPLDITSDAVYTAPDQKEIDALLRSRKEKRAEIEAGVFGFVFGAGMLGWISAALTYQGLSEIANETLRHISYAIPVVQVAVAGFIGTNIGRALTDHGEDLKLSSNTRRSNAAVQLNFLYEVYIKGGFDSRVSARVKELRQARANENTAIITHAQRAENYSRTSYERLFAARVAHELGMTTSDPKARVLYMMNAATLRELEKVRGLPCTAINYQEMIEAGERQFREASDQRDYGLMGQTAQALTKVAETYEKEPDVSEENRKLLNSYRYSWGIYSDSGIPGACAKMERWDRKVRKSTKPARIKKFEDKIEAKFTSIQPPVYRPVN